MIEFESMYDWYKKSKEKEKWKKDYFVFCVLIHKDTKQTKRNKKERKTHTKQSYGIESNVFVQG